MLIPKDEWERKIFSEFADVAGLHVDPGSIVNGEPPEPDIRYTSRGVIRWFELVEVTDEGLARIHMTSLKTGAITGGTFSQRVPLERSIKSKAGKTYQTGGAQLDLLAYYDKQYPSVSVEPDLIPETMGPVASEMIASGTWAGVWVYDGWKRRVLWTYPKSETDATIVRER